MVNITLIKFNSNLAVSVWGAKRENFKKNTVISVSKSDVLPLLRLGCSIEWECTIDYKTDKKVLDEKCKAFWEAKEKVEAKVQIEAKKQANLVAKNKKEVLEKKANEVFFKMIDNRTLSQLDDLMKDLDKAVEVEQPINKKECTEYIQKVHKVKLAESKKEKEEKEALEVEKEALKTANKVEADKKAEKETEKAQ